MPEYAAVDLEHERSSPPLERTMDGGLTETIKRHYTVSELATRILEALEKAGKDPSRLSVEDLAPIDEFHVRGRQATLELAEAAGIKSRDTVLDVGSGIGGPARCLASQFGCQVTGLDLTEEYCRAAPFTFLFPGREARTQASWHRQSNCDAWSTTPVSGSSIGETRPPRRASGLSLSLKGQGGKERHSCPGGCSWAMTSSRWHRTSGAISKKTGSPLFSLSRASSRPDERRRLPGREEG